MADGGEEVALGLRLLPFNVAFTAAEDCDQGDHQDERKDVKPPLHKTVTDDRAVHDRQILPKSGTPVVATMILMRVRRRPFRMAVIGMVVNDGVIRPFRGFVGRLVHPHQ